MSQNHIRPTVFEILTPLYLAPSSFKFSYFSFWSLVWTLLSHLNTSGHLFFFFDDLFPFCVKHFYIYLIKGPVKVKLSFLLIYHTYVTYCVCCFCFVIFKHCLMLFLLYNTICHISNRHIRCNINLYVCSWKIIFKTPWSVWRTQAYFASGVYLRCSSLCINCAIVQYKHKTWNSNTDFFHGCSLVLFQTCY